MMRWMVLALVACGSPAPSRSAPEQVEVEHTHAPCLEAEESTVSTRVAGDFVIFDSTTVEHCASPRATVTELGRVRGTKTAACPIGEVAYRSWGGGQGFSAAIASPASPELKQALAARSGDGYVVAYVLGCGASEDFVIIPGRDPRIELWVGNQIVPSDPRFVPN